MDQQFWDHLNEGGASVTTSEFCPDQRVLMPHETQPLSLYILDLVCQSFDEERAFAGVFGLIEETKLHDIHENTGNIGSTQQMWGLTVNGRFLPSKTTTGWEGVCSG